MKKIAYLFFTISLFIKTDLFSNKYSDELYSKIEDLCNPSDDDYRLIENYLRYGFRKYTYRLDSWQYRGKARNISLLSPENLPIQHEIIPVNCDDTTRENCIILYTSFNFNYPNCLLNLVKIIQDSDFVGHIIYRIGGWPNVEAGDLSLSHLPYAFKLCAFNEAYRLGFKRVLWLDAPMRPKISLNKIFEWAEPKGIFTYDSGLSLFEESKYAEQVYKALELTKEEACNSYCINIGILALDFSHPIAMDIFNEWNHRTRTNEEASFSLRPEQSLFSAILNKHYPLSTFKKFSDHINTKNLAKLEFAYSKKEAQPNWPN